MYYLFLACCVVLVIVPAWFVCHCVYQDGAIGRLSLLGIAFIALTFLLQFLAGVRYELLPQTVCLVASFTLFLCWHLFRFHRRVLKQRGGEERAWQ